MLKRHNFIRMQKPSKKTFQILRIFPSSLLKLMRSIIPTRTSIRDKKVLKHISYNPDSKLAVHLQSLSTSKENHTKFQKYKQVNCLWEGTIKGLQERTKISFNLSNKSQENSALSNLSRSAISISGNKSCVSHIFVQHC